VAGLVVAAWPKRRTISFNGEARPGDPFSLLANATRLSALGFAPKIRVDVGIEEYVRWYLSSDRAAL
jgi:UDP-glucose 4-epimerase